MKITLLVVALNEIEGMKAIMPQIDRNWCDQILVMDGGSTDGTAEWAEANGYEVFCQKTPGLRHGYIEAFEKVTGDAVITFSPDGNCLASSMPALIRKIREGYDLVIASRYFDGDTSEDDTLITRFGNWLFTTTINVLFGGRYSDALSIYRAFRRSVFYDLDLHKEESYRFAESTFSTTLSIEPLMSVRALKCRMQIAEVPGHEPARIGGQSKLPIIRWGAAYYTQFLREVFCWRKSAAAYRLRYSTPKIPRPVNNA